VIPSASFSPRSFRLVGALYLLSGALGLIYEVTFSKYLGLSFGSTATASSTVLVAFMGGLAIGASITGKLEGRIARPLSLYGMVELAIGAFCLIAPALFERMRPLYFALAQRTESLALLGTVRGFLALLIVAVPAAGMGSTLPLLARFVQASHGAHGGRIGSRLAALYGLNTLGGALGSLGAAYLLLPSLGLSLTLRGCAAISVGIGVLCVALGRGLRVPPSGAESSPGESAARKAAGLPTLAPRAAYGLAALSGLLVFSCEVIIVHLLALVIGTSAYAFGLMLSIFLVCLSFGTPLARWLERRWPRRALTLSFGASGLALLLSLPIWDELPRVFVALGPSVRSWHGRELVRGVAAFVALAVPVTLMGTAFPLLLRAARAPHLVRDTGRITASNTLGAIAGSLLAGFVLLERLGSYRSLALVALVYLVGCVLAAEPREARLSRVLAVVGVSLLVLLPRWDLQRLASGANVYFDVGAVENGVIESIHEDLHGGVTTIVRSPTTGERTLLTNGKFQGNDRGEVAQNRGLGLLPSFFAGHTERALLIGLGTGVTAAALAQFPYQRIDVAELAPAIVDAARSHFVEVNAHVLNDPRVRVFGEDGRNLLAVRRTIYDVITVEVSSLWFAGAADLYHREFYAIARQRLRRGGVLQQWIAFHHTNREIVATILATLRASFPHVMLFVDGHQGHILASMQPLRARLERIEDFAEAHDVSLDQLLRYVRGAVLDSAAIDAFVADTGRLYERAEPYISSDDNRALEYMSPKGNVPMADNVPATLGYLYEYMPAGIVPAHVQL
jgi:spermidine synthase